MILCPKCNRDAEHHQHGSTYSSGFACTLTATDIMRSLVRALQSRNDIVTRNAKAWEAVAKGHFAALEMHRDAGCKVYGD